MPSPTACGPVVQSGSAAARWPRAARTQRPRSARPSAGLPGRHRPASWCDEEPWPPSIPGELVMPSGSGAGAMETPATAMNSPSQADVRPRHVRRTRRCGSKVGTTQTGHYRACAPIVPPTALRRAVRLRTVFRKSQARSKNTRSPGNAETSRSEADEARTRDHRIDSQLWLFGQGPIDGQKPGSRPSPSRSTRTSWGRVHDQFWVSLRALERALPSTQDERIKPRPVRPSRSVISGTMEHGLAAVHHDEGARRSHSPGGS
jgi:hypothetical protein